MKDKIFSHLKHLLLLQLRVCLRLDIAMTYPGVKLAVSLILNFSKFKEALD